MMQQYRITSTSCNKQWSVTSKCSILNIDLLYAFVLFRSTRRGDNLCGHGDEFGGCGGYKGKHVTKDVKSGNLGGS